MASGSSDDHDLAQRLLRRHGLRITRQRTVVLAALLGTGGHRDAAAVIRVVRDGGQRLSVQAVYNVLDALSRHQVIRRIEPPGKPALFETRVGDNHHHLICRDCGSVTNQDCAAPTVPCLEPSDDLGYLIDEAEITWFGRCPDCAKNDPS